VGRKRKRKNSLIPQQSPNPGVMREVNAVARVEQHYFAGPLPPPTVLAQYNEIVINGADRIIAMAERQSAHRESLEAEVVTGNVAAQKRGSIYAFIISMTVILCGTFVIHEGHSAYGLAAILADLAGVAGVFVYSRNVQRKERDEKSDALAERRKR
jgi:uncharacterized membrane protein